MCASSVPKASWQPQLQSWLIVRGRLTASLHAVTSRFVMAGDRGIREFLQKHGVVGVTAQRLLEQFGTLTEEKVREDPYTALTKTSPGSTFRYYAYCLIASKM